MGTQGPELDRFVRRLSCEARVLVLGGLAVIAHGLSRATKDADVWMEPFADGREWAERLFVVVADFPAVKITTLPGWRLVGRGELPQVVEEIGLVRILGLECPLDIFRRPNNLGPEDFESAFGRAIPSEDGTWLPDPIDLLVTKEDTARDSDRADITFLEGKVRGDFCSRLSHATLAEAESLLGRYSDHAVLDAALKNPDRAVQSLALGQLRELAETGDPFARDMLRERGIDAS